MYDSLVSGDCEVLIDEDMNEYERMAREHDNRQPFIQDELVEGIKSYNCIMLTSNRL